MGGGHASGCALVGVTVAMTVVAGLATILRLVTRTLVAKTAGFDDLTILIAMGLSITLTITMWLSVVHGVGRHYDTLKESEQTESLIWMWASIWVYYLALGAAKCSILLQYLRIFPHNGFRTACYIMLGIIAVYTCWTFFSAVFACLPVSSFWEPNTSGHCLNRLAVWFTNAAINIITDIATAVLPLPVLKGLELPKQQKYALMAVFALAGLTCVVSILRLQALYAISVTTDPTWENPMAALYSSTEVNVGILCSCLPILKGTISHFFPRLFPERTHRSVVEMRAVAPLSSERFGASSSEKVANRKRRTWDEDDEKYLGRQVADDEAIHVVTIVEQSVGDGDKAVDPYPWESESTRNLVHISPPRSI